MHPIPTILRVSRRFTPPLFRFVLPVSLSLFLSVSVSVARAADTSTLTGTVSNTATGNLLEGARIAVPALGLSVLTDPTGT